MRHAVSSSPLTQPWVRMASMPYWLQEGEKRQFRPSPGLDELLVEPDEPAEGFLKDAHASGFRTGGRVAGGFAPGCFALSGRPAWAKSFATMALSCQLLSRGSMPRATKTRS